MPRVVENMLDAKVELDGRLRTVINELTNGFANRMTSNISGAAVAKKSFDAPAATVSMRQDIENQVPFLRKKLDEYLEDVRTKETLVGAIQDQVIQIYEDFYDAHVVGKDGKQVGTKKVLSKKGKGREDETWDPDAFTDWALSVFRVGNLAIPEEEDEQGSRSVSMSRNGSM
jgi:conserved oligomeric Golgi complex subunit 3